MRAASAFLLLGVMLACHASPEVVHPPALPPPAPGTCNPSSIASPTACPERSIPKSNASSRSGCKSDKDCKDGIEGRCVESGSREEDSSIPVARSNAMAAAPRPPPPTICTYDACRADKDCSGHARCVCGEGQERAACVALDGCLADKDCGEGALCACGESGYANQCTPGNCRSDADCAGSRCVAVRSGRFCASPGDRCRTSADCKEKSSEGSVECDWDTSTKAFTCRLIPYPPPG